MKSPELHLTLGAEYDFNKDDWEEGHEGDVIKLPVVHDFIPGMTVSLSQITVKESSQVENEFEIPSNISEIFPFAKEGTYIQVAPKTRERIHIIHGGQYLHSIHGDPSKFQTPKPLKVSLYIVSFIWFFFSH